MKKIFGLLLLCLIVQTMQAMDVLESINALNPSPNQDVRVHAESVYCTVNGQEYRLSDLLNRAIPVVGLHSQDIQNLKRDNQVNGPTLQAYVSAINSIAPIIDNHTEVINQHAGAITTNGNAVTQHAGFINKHEEVLKNTTLNEINKASAIYVISRHPIIRSIVAKAPDPDYLGVYLATILVEGSLSNIQAISSLYTDNDDISHLPDLLSTVIGVTKTSFAIGISYLMSPLMNRAGLNKYAQDDMSKMATFVASRAAVNYVGLLCWQKLEAYKASSASA